MSSPAKQKHSDPNKGDLSAFRAKLEGTRDIKRILIANNGLAAVKGINSIRKWLFDHLEHSEAIEFVVMATPEDLASNAEFIRLADHHVEVPGGSNANNYANVELIVNTAVQQGVDAVYPGWGHASENPALPRELEKTRTKIIFLGPPEGPMFSLGDKIASTIVAQCHGVPTVPWSGYKVSIPKNTFQVEPALYEKAYVQTWEKCKALCEEIGFPVMIKASEGGGGKGIRRCFNLDEVQEKFQAVEAEVVGCHIFVMRLLENVRHLEVQLLADKYGNCIAVRTRDCSVQRRHQKIIEEGPVVSVPENVVPEMEASAVRLALAVGYSGLGTVEFMYNRDNHTFSFLELNPRIQVEHPVSELVSGVNLPAALVCVGMGVPLYRIPEVRELYNEDKNGTSVIDFTKAQPAPPKGHTIAVRITAEDANEGFQPTSGSIDELNFSNSKDVWGYFSVVSGGRVHEYADSQFGHIFSSGATREEARRGAVMALRGLHVRGEIRTSIGFLIDLLETTEFRESTVHTAWLDALLLEQKSNPVTEDVYPALAAAAIMRFKLFRESNLAKYRQFLKAGHTPAVDFLSNRRSEILLLHGRKFVVDVGMLNATDYAISFNGTALVVPCREFSAGSLQMTLNKRTVIAYAEEEQSSLRITINGKGTIFTADVDPTMLRSTVPGRLVRFLVQDGAHVNEGQAYAEVEVMKMVMQLKSGVTGTAKLRATAGCTLVAGKLLVEVDPDDPSAVARPTLEQGTWPEHMLPEQTAANASPSADRLDTVTRVRTAVDSIWSLLQGYQMKEVSMHSAIEAFVQDALPALYLSSVNIASLNRLFLATCTATTSPTDKVSELLECFVDNFLATEKWFDNQTRGDALDKMRDHFGTDEEKDMNTIFEMDFAHHHEHRQVVLKSLLQYLEGNHQLLKSCKPMLERLNELQSSSQYGIVLLQARYLLRQSNQPSFDDRVTALLAELEQGDMSKITNHSVGLDVLAGVMFSPRAPQLTPLALELFIRRAHFGFGTVAKLEVFKTDKVWRASWHYEADGDKALYASPKSPTASHKGRGLNIPKSGEGHSALFLDHREMLDGISAFLSATNGEPSNACVANALFSVRPETTMQEMKAFCVEAVNANLKTLESGKLEHLTFVVAGATYGPHLFTFSKGTKFEENTIHRNVLPTTAARLEMYRLANFKVEMFPTPHRAVHTYIATPNGLTKPRPSDHRLFVRVYLSSGDLGVETGSNLSDVDGAHAIGNVLTAVEFARSDKKLAATVFNHLFINLMDVSLDLTTITNFIRNLSATYEKRFFKLGFREVEIKFVSKSPEGPVTFRAFMVNRTTYALQVELFVETIDDSGAIILRRATYSSDVDRITEMPHENDTSIAMTDSGDDRSSGNEANDSALIHRRLRDLSMIPGKKRAKDSNPENEDTVSLIYAPLSTLQMKRLQAQATGTTYVKDWMLLFEVALRQSWKELVQKRGLAPSAVPYQGVWHPEELFYSPATGKLSNATPADYKPAGMVVWRCNYFPASYYDIEKKVANQRTFYIVANDVTFQSGSFSVSEDVVFKAASDLARDDKLPFVYVSANAGARLGLCNEVKKVFQVATKGDTYDYIYLSPADLEALSAKGVVVNCEKIEVDGSIRHKILDVIGTDSDYIGVENLQGSALIAGHMSLNYATIPTLSIATGRTVGIGAYLVRLGRRVIQTKNSPIILTGAGALNRLLGKEVYSGNSQLGGNAIMQPNGVTHWEAADDLVAVKQTMDWLDFLPPTTETPAVALTLKDADPVDRDVTFSPARDQPYDPRCLIQGGEGTVGMFDRGSFRESLSDWAKSVVTGRATLGGIPCGVVVVETRITKKFNPADPADPSSTSTFGSQAGQVWFPDSARKTADALEDFHHESLPCFILANWRGFSGGMRDMYDEVMKFGASIVDNLRVYKNPVYIYIPPFGELRGGAWVVVDPVINHNGCVEMYCDTQARGGILEPAGVVEIKFRDEDLRSCMRRNDGSLRELRETDAAAADKKETQSLQLYNDIAIHFADLHDTPGRMKAKGCIVDVIPWKNARRSFHSKLTRKMAELRFANQLVSSGGEEDTVPKAQLVLQKWFSEAQPKATWGDDAAVTAWFKAEGAQVTRRCEGIKATATVAQLMKQLQVNATGADSQTDLTKACVAALGQNDALRTAMTEALKSVSK